MAEDCSSQDLNNHPRVWKFLPYKKVSPASWEPLLSKQLSIGLSTETSQHWGKKDLIFFQSGPAWFFWLFSNSSTGPQVDGALWIFATGSPSPIRAWLMHSLTERLPDMPCPINNSCYRVLFFFFPQWEWTEFWLTLGLWQTVDHFLLNLAWVPVIILLLL